MADMATTVGAMPHGGSLLDKKMKKSSAWISGGVVAIALLGGLAYIGFHVSQDLGRRLIAEGHQRVNFAIVGSGPNSASPHHDATNAWEALARLRNANMPEPMIPRMMGQNAAKQFGIEASDRMTA